MLSSRAKRGRPPRPVPADFEQRWPEFGWSAAELEWRASARTIRRWLAELGAEWMAARRREYLSAQRALRDRDRRKTYRWP